MSEPTNRPSSAAYTTDTRAASGALGSSASSGVSWGAIFAGAAGAAALSLILVVLGTGLGMASVSPWSGEGVAASTFGIAAVVWLTLTQILASGMGGFLAGRLRTRWQSLHGDEIYFRDTAHGFLSWAVATLVTAALLTSAVTSVVGGGAKAAASMAGGVAGTAATAAGPVAAAAADRVGGASAGQGDSGMSYFVDSLFRRDAAASPAGTASSPSAATPADAARSTAEVGRIIATSVANGSMAPQDTRYVGQIVAQQTGLSQQDAEKRVTDTFASLQDKAKKVQAAAQEAADKARKGSAYGSLWLFVSLLAGAFAASLCATYGGRRRDLH